MIALNIFWRHPDYKFLEESYKVGENWVQKETDYQIGRLGLDWLDCSRLERTGNWLVAVTEQWGMAGVIARVSLHNEKDRKGVKQVANNKSNYVLPKFDKTFQPVKHNIFLIRSANIQRGKSWPFNLRRANYLEVEEQRRRRSGLEETEGLEEERAESPLRCGRVCIEILLVCLLLSLVPAGLVLIQLSWPSAQDTD